MTSKVSSAARSSIELPQHVAGAAAAVEKAQFFPGLQMRLQQTLHALGAFRLVQRGAHFFAGPVRAQFVIALVFQREVRLGEARVGKDESAAGALVHVEGRRVAVAENFFEQDPQGELGEIEIADVLFDVLAGKGEGVLRDHSEFLFRTDGAMVDGFDACSFAQSPVRGQALRILPFGPGPIRLRSRTASS